MEIDDQSTTEFILLKISQTFYFLFFLNDS